MRYGSTVKPNFFIKYMVTDNLDVEEGIVNGAIGQLVEVTMDETAECSDRLDKI